MRRATFFRKGLPRIHHLHVVIGDSWEHRHHISFRDWLREHSEDAREHEELKGSLAVRYRQYRDAYCQSKSVLVERILVRAEGLVKGSGLDWTILRPSGIYAPSNEDDVACYFITSFNGLASRFIIGSGKNIIQFVHV
jgi:nucleoside-diphosphate-sugar epimerase